MGGLESGKGSRDISPKKIDDSQGMCVSESDYDTCWNRICSPNRSTVLRDVLRGLLVLIGLAIVITVIFLLCYFLINDMEKKEEEIVDTLVKDFSSGHPMAAESEFDIVDENRLAPSDLETYETVPLLREDPGLAGVTLHEGEDERSNIQHLGNQGAFENIAVDSELPQHAEGDLMDSFMPGKELFDTAPEIMGETGKECVPLRLPLCSGSMPWSVTAFPNFVNNNNLFELQESLKYFQSIIVGSRCSARATEYTCAILEPSCGPDMVPLPPCRAFCEDIVQTCSEYFIGGNEHNSAFQCDRFPDSKNPNVCVDISRALPTQQSEPQADLAQDKAIADESSVLAKQDITGIPLEAVLEGREETAPEIVEMPTTEKTKSEPKMEVTSAVSNATESPVFICDHSKFLCDDGSDCLGNEFVCDGVQHCLDNSDEFNCTMSEKKPDLPIVLGDMQAETTTHFDIASNLNFGKGVEHSLNEKPSKRFSLSDMLSDSSLVAVPSSATTNPPTPQPSETRQLRFGLSRPFPKTGKTLESSLSPEDTPEVIKPSKQLSLADILSSSSLKPGKPLGVGSKSVTAIDFEDQLTPSSQRSLSALLSSALPSFSAIPIRNPGTTCKELKCLDGTCISMKQIGDGIRDCPDGTDERQGNHISLNR